METRTVGVAGLGLLGRGIAACLVSHGFRVIAFTRRDTTHEEARRYITQAIGDLIDRAGFPAELATEWPSRYHPVTSLDAFAPCDFVIETVLEDPAVKQQVFDEVEALVGADVPIASNTSSIPISLLQQGRRHPERFVGMHWAEPCHITRFMELIRGQQTSDRAFAAVAEFARAVGKEPSLVQKDIPAFIVNRLGYVMYREAVHLLEMGVADAATIDRSFRNALGLWATLCGPLRWMDLTGGPALYARAIARVLPTCDNSAEVPKTLQELADRDAQGIANGRGFYSYTEDEIHAWEQRLREHAWTVRGLLDQYFPLDQP